MTVITRHETKLVRPFSGWRAVKGLLDDAKLRLGATATPSGELFQVVRVEDAASLEPALWPCLNADNTANGLLELGIAPSGVDLAVVATVRALRLSTVVVRRRLDEELPEEIDLSRVTPYLTNRSGTEIGVLLILREGVAPTPLRPSEQGQWLARKLFRIGPEKPNEDFRIEPLKEEDRVRFGLPMGRTFYLERHGTINSSESTLGSAVTVWVEETAYNAFARSSISPASAALQKALLADVVASLVMQELSAPDTEVMPNSPLDHFFRDLAKATKSSPKTLVGWIRTDPGRFRTYVQAAVDLTGSIRDAF